MTFSRILGKSFEILVDSIYEKLEKLAPISPEEARYQEELNVWHAQGEKIIEKGLDLARGGKFGEGNALLKKHNGSKPKRKLGFAGHKSLRINRKILENAIQLVMVEDCLARSENDKELTAAYERAVIARLCPKPPPPFKKRQRFPEEPIPTFSKPRQTA